MLKSYEDSQQLFNNFLNNQINSIKSKLKNIEYYTKIRNIYKELKNRDYSKILENYEVLSKINDNIKENLDIISYLVKNNVTFVPQIDESINNILNDNELLKIVGNHESKEMLLGKLEIFKNILSGKYDFQSFKNALLSSGLPDEDIISILTHEAEKTVEIKKEELPSLKEDNSRKNELLSQHKEILDKINELLNKYYYLIEQKQTNLIEMYRRTISAINMKEINKIYSESDVLLCMHLLNLISLKTEANELLEVKPIDYSLVEINIEELLESYNLALDAVEKYKRELADSIPLDANVYFVLEDGLPLFDINDFSEEEKKNISSLLMELEMGLYDYERNKGAHTKLKQDIRKDLNVFINRKRNIAVSYLRINSSDLRDSKVLILTIEEYRNIFDKSQNILNVNSALIDRHISLMSDNDKEFNKNETDFREKLNSKLPREDVQSL